MSVCKIAWAEMMAAMARRVREIPEDADTIDSGRNRFEQMWLDFAVIEINQKLVKLAGDIAEAFALRAYDSFQRAAAQRLHHGANRQMTFACFDKRLQKAAAVMGLQVLEFS
jgi:predicted nucleic acid-binding protein